MSPVPHEPFADLAAAYAIGGLDGDEQARFEAHLRSGCTECDRAVAEHREALVEVARGLAEPPPPRVRRLLVERLARESAVRRPPARFWRGIRWAASVAVAAGLLASLVSVYVSSQYESRIGQMAREAAALREQVQQQLLALALLRDPETLVVQLNGLEPSPNARARMIWHGRDGGVLLTSDLPPAPHGKAYELWVIAAGKPVGAGVFNVDDEGKGGIRVAPIPNVSVVDQFAVTLEPAGGVSAPTGPMYLASAR